MRAVVKWETTIAYQRPIEIDVDALAEHGGDVEAYITANIDELLADHEEDFDDGLLTADVGERELVEVDVEEIAHVWQHGRFTGTKTCELCGLLPLDEDDIDTPCTGTRTN